MDLFWSFLFAIQVVLGIPVDASTTLPAKEVRYILFTLIREYHDESIGGVTSATLLKLFSPLDTNLHSRLANLSNESIVSLNSLINCLQRFPLISLSVGSSD